MLVLLPALLICLLSIGLAEGSICSSSSLPSGSIACPQPGDPGHYTRCCGMVCCSRQAYSYYKEVAGLESEDDYFHVDNGEFIDGFKKSPGKDDEMLHIPPKTETSKEDSLLETKTVLQDEEYFNGFLIEISVGIMLVVVMCIICSIPLMVRKTRGQVIHDEADEEGQQHRFHHQDSELLQGILRSSSARTFLPLGVAYPQQTLPHRPDSPYPGGYDAFRQWRERVDFIDQDDYVPYATYLSHPHLTHIPSLLPQCLDPPPTYPGPYPGGDAPHPQMITQLWAETEDVDQEDYLPSYDEAVG